MNFITIIISVLAGLGFYFFERLKPTKPGEKLIPVNPVPNNVKKWFPLAEKYAQQFGINPVDVISVIWVESAGDFRAVGSAGEVGLMQLKKIAVQDVKQNYPDEDFTGWDTIPEQNIKAGTAFLALQIKRAGTVAEGLKAYNQGITGAKIYPDRANLYLTKVQERKQSFGIA